MLLPWILVILVLTAALIGLIYTTKKRVDEHRHEHPPRTHHNPH